MALTKAAVKAKIESFFNPIMEQNGFEKHNEDGILVWRISPRAGQYFAFTAQLDQHPFSDETGGRFILRFIASPDKDVFYSLDREDYEPKGSLRRALNSKKKTGIFDSFLNAFQPKGWIQIYDLNEVEPALNVLKEDALKQFEEFARSKNASIQVKAQ